MSEWSLLTNPSISMSKARSSGSHMSVNSAKIVFFASTDDDRESDLADDGDVGSGLERPTGLVLLPLAGCLGSRHILVVLVPPMLPRQR